MMPANELPSEPHASTPSSVSASNSTAANVAAPRIPATVVVIAKNEASNIPRCLDALQSFAEIVVVDDHSSDDTVALATERGARVVTHRFESFAKQRNWALQEAGLQHDWVLMLDADEVATPEFCTAIRHFLASCPPETVAAKTCRKTMFLGTWLKYSDGFPVWIARLVRRDRFAFEDSGHGEVPVPRVTGLVGEIREPFLHFPFSKGIADWIERHNRYSTREAAKELAESAGIAWSDLLAGDRSRRRQALRHLSRQLPARAVLRFCYQYFWKWGWLEGRAGLTFSWLMAMYEGLIVIKRREAERLRSGQSL